MKVVASTIFVALIFTIIMILIIQSVIEGAR